MKKELRLSVHELVDFLLRTGDIDNRIYNQNTMQRGSELHATYQKSRANNYLSEYYLNHEFIVDDFKIILEGRADGIYQKEIPVIEEIKSTVDDLDNFFIKNKDWHLGQAICYAYMFLKERNKIECQILLNYISQINDSKKEYSFSFKIEELQKKVYELLNEYINFYKLIYEHKTNRNKSIEEIKFPYLSYRKGQRTFMKEVYDNAVSGGISFIEAPTGIGKTISAIYPSIKSFSKTDNEKIFYLTAKNTGKEIAYLTIDKLNKKGLDIFAIYITAKEKICASIGSSCNPIECPFAKDYYTHLKEAILYAIKEEKLFNSYTVKKITDKFKICPFEFSLDLSNYMDIVIADYNYFFDPIIRLERYFETSNDNYVLLIDEAHNLVDRAKDMYSENISLSLLKSSKEDYRYATNKLKRAFTRLINNFKNLSTLMNEKDMLVADLEHETYLSIYNLFNNLKEFSKEHIFHPSECSVDLSRKLNKFIKLYENLDEEDAIYYEKKDKDFILNLYCLDASSRLANSLNSIKSAIFFSATLTPIDYYINVLGGNESSHKLILPSPFDKNNFKLLISPINVRYKNRDLTINNVLTLIDEFINNKKGNYLIFAPSFEYLDKITPYFMDKKYSEIYIQNRDMNELEKEIFLSHFKRKGEHSVIGLGVLGGAFSEGIDLVDNSLIGVVIVGVGLPTISFKRNLIKDYYDSKEINGFSYSYKHPGMNKVTQAVGRLIRSENDKGAALLIDERYLLNQYRKLFKKEWLDYEVVNTKEDIKEILNNFYSKK